MKTLKKPEESSVCANIRYEDTPLLERGRDSRIFLEEETHVYYVDDRTDFMSVTTWNHMHFAEFVPHETVKTTMEKAAREETKYTGMTREEILKMWADEGDEASRAGTDFHYAVECYYRGKPIDQEIQKSVEWSYFLNFARDHSNLTPYKSEWRVFDEDLKLAGTIDMTFVTDDGKILIYDWKRCKEIRRENTWQSSTTPEISHLQDSNFWHYALQLNTYKYILEKRYNREVTEMCIVSMHPNNESETYDKYELPNLQAEIADLMIVRMDMMKHPNYVTSTGEIMKRQAEILNFMATIKTLRCKLTELVEEFIEKETIDWKFFNDAVCKLVEKGVLKTDPLNQDVWITL